MLQKPQQPWTMRYICQTWMIWNLDDDDSEFEANHTLLHNGEWCGLTRLQCPDMTPRMPSPEMPVSNTRGRCYHLWSTPLLSIRCGSQSDGQTSFRCLSGYSFIDPLLILFILGNFVRLGWRIIVDDKCKLNIKYNLIILQYTAGNVQDYWNNVCMCVCMNVCNRQWYT